MKFAGTVIDARAAQREDPVQLGEAQVVADREAEPDAVAVSERTISPAGSECSDSRYTTPPTSMSNMWILR